MKRPLNLTRQYPLDANRYPIYLSETATGWQVAASVVGTGVERLAWPDTGDGTNAAAKVSGGERETTFTLTGLNTSTSKANLKGWILEITQSGYENKYLIRSTTNANPAVATIFRSPELPPNVVGTFWCPDTKQTLPDSGNVTYRVYPMLKNPMTILFSPLAVGTLTILRESNDTTGVNNAHNVVSILRPGGSVTISVDNPSKIYYVFSSNAATEIFYWCESSVNAAVIASGGATESTLAKISGSTPIITNATGAAAIATSYAPAAAFWLESVTLNLNTAPTTSESFTITLNANDGAAYDTLLQSVDLSAAATTDLVYKPDGGPLLCESGDAIDVAWANTDTKTYGLRIAARLA